MYNFVSTIGLRTEKCQIQQGQVYWSGHKVTFIIYRTTCSQYKVAYPLFKKKISIQLWTITVLKTITFKTVYNAYTVSTLISRLLTRPYYWSSLHVNRREAGTFSHVSSFKTERNRQYNCLTQKTLKCYAIKHKQVLTLSNKPSHLYSS